MSAGGPDLFVVCKSCGSEVSPYITECPYCGNRLRKRAPKIDRQGQVSEKKKRRSPAPALPRLRRDEIPGIRADGHPYATLALVLASLIGALLWRTSLFPLDDVVVVHKVGSDWWKLITAPLTYDNSGYAFAALLTIAVYGWLLERRHGPIAPLLMFAIGGVGGTAAASAVGADPYVLGGNGAALAMLGAWAVPDLLSLRAGEEIEGDLLGTAVLAVVVALMPLAVPSASWPADGVGVIAGLLLGYPISRLRAG